MKNNVETEILLSVKDLIVEYKSEGGIIHAVNGVSFEIKKGETVGLVGETGAGKTTIAKSILRILPKAQSIIRSGSVQYENEELMTMSELEMQSIRGNKISMIFQDPMSALNPVMTVGDQIAEAIELHQKLTKKETQKLVEQMLEIVGIPGARHKEYPLQFSGGMKQRVVIAIALACNPELLLADEPTTALDVTIQAQVLDMIAKLKKDFNTAMMLITHDLGIVAETCDRVLIIYAGEIVEVGTTEQIFDMPLHPYTKGLFESLPRIDDDDDKRLEPIKGLMPNPINLPSGCKFAPRCPIATNLCREKSDDLREVKGHRVRCFYAGGES
jgi:peptide/nickel transport system ATP-binding protein